MHCIMLRSLAVSRYLSFGTLACASACALSQVEVNTYHNNNMRTGLNPYETLLTPSNVSNSSQFGLLFSLPVNAQVYAQPLYLPIVSIPGKGVHSVVYVATENNSVYAFDANSSTGANAKPLWKVNLGPSVPNGDVGTDDINPIIGITSTPVIYTTPSGLKLLYVVGKTKTMDSNGNPVYTQSLHALSVSSGKEELGGPVVISGQVGGMGDGSSNGIVAFNPLIQSNRTALLMVPSARDGTLYIGYASHGDNGPYHGWLFMYDPQTLKQIAIYNTTPNALTDPSGYPLAAGGIWEGGAGPASDGTSIYYATGNGTFDPTTGAFGDAVVRMFNRSITVADYFAPADQQSLDDDDGDLGSGGVMLIPTEATAPSKVRLAVDCGKEGSVYVMNTANLGGNGSSNNIYQDLEGVIGGIWGAPAYFNKTVYFGPIYSPLVSFPISGGLLSTSPAAYSPTTFYYPGPTPSVSSNGTSNGIVWAIQTDAYSSGGPAILHAYDATNVANELYDSSATNGRDTLAGAVKFAVPTIVGGKVYVGCAGSVGVFGLGNFAGLPEMIPASGKFSGSVTVKLFDGNAHAQIRYTTDGSLPTASSPLYMHPLTISSTVTLRARAFINNGNASGAATGKFVVAPGR